MSNQELPEAVDQAAGKNKDWDLDDSILKSGVDVELALLHFEDELRLQLLGKVGLRQVEEGHQALQGGRHDRWAPGQADLKIRVESKT